VWRYLSKGPSHRPPKGWPQSSQGWFVGDPTTVRRRGQLPLGLLGVLFEQRMDSARPPPFFVAPVGEKGVFPPFARIKSSPEETRAFSENLYIDRFSEEILWAPLEKTSVVVLRGFPTAFEENFGSPNCFSPGGVRLQHGRFLKPH